MHQGVSMPFCRDIVKYWIESTALLLKNSDV